MHIFHQLVLIPKTQFCLRVKQMVCCLLQPNYQHNKHFTIFLVDIHAKLTKEIAKTKLKHQFPSLRHVLAKNFYQETLDFMEKCFMKKSNSITRMYGLLTLDGFMVNMDKVKELVMKIFRKLLILLLKVSLRKSKHSKINTLILVFLKRLMILVKI